MQASEIQIPEPCDENWDAMTPAERGRFCSTCQTKVHDLSAMPESDAQALLESDDDICISYLSTAGGEVRFQPDRVVPIHRLVRRASMATAAGLSLALAACAPHGDGPQIEQSAETERPALLELEPAIPDAEPCETQPPPEVVPQIEVAAEPLPASEVAPHIEVAPRIEALRPRMGRRKVPKKDRRTRGVKRRMPESR